MITDILKQWLQEKGYHPEALRLYGEDQPKVIIFGEDHRVEKHREDQLDLTARLGSSHFLHEDFRNLIYNRTAKVLVEGYPVPEKVQKWREEEVLNPEYRREDEGYRDFLDWQRKNGVTVHMHRFDAYWFSGYLPRINKIVNNLPPSVTLVAGCDLSYAEIKWYEKIFGGYISNAIDYGLREQRMAEAVLDSLKQTTSIPIVGVGRAHMREGQQEYTTVPSHIHTRLQEHGISYATIDQIKHP